MEPSLCSLYGFDIFLCDGCFYNGCLSPLFFMYADLHPLDNSGIDVVVTRVCTGYWAGPPLCPVIVTEVGLAPNGWSRDFQICILAMFLTCDVRSLGFNTPPRREATEYSSSGAAHLWVCSVVALFTPHAGSQITLLVALLSALL